MRSAFVYISGRLKEMPASLHGFTALSVFAPIFALGFYFRGGPQVHVGLPRILAIAIFCAVLIYGLLQATKWSRPLVLLLFAASTIQAIVQHHGTYSFAEYLALLAGNGFFVWMLYFRGDVRDYYARARKPVV